MSFIKEMMTHPLRMVKTTVLFLSFFGLGLNVASIGPCLLDFQILVNSTFQETSALLPARSFGYAVGSVLYGLVNNLMDPHFLLVIIFSLFILNLVYIPLCSKIILMILLFFFNGVCSGSLDTAGNSWIIHLWGEKNAPFLQVLHFCFGFGAFVFPLIAERFLVPLEKLDCLNFNETIFVQNFTSCSYTKKDLKIQYPFWIIAITYFLTLASFIMITCRQPTNKPHSSVKQKENSTQNEQKKEFKLNLCFYSCAILFFFTLVALEIPYGGLLATFAVKSDLKLDKSTASFITSTYWGSYTFFRINTVFMILFFNIQQIISFNLVLVLLANIILGCFGNRNVWALWVGSFVLGSGTSSIFPSMITFCNEVIPVTPKFTSIILIASACGEFLTPLIIGFFIDEYPNVFLIVNMICSLNIFIFFGLLVILRKKILQFEQ